MKDFAKSIVCNTKAGNSNKAEIIEKKKKEGATLKVDNGQKLEFSDGSTYVKTSFSDDYREAHNYTGNTKVGNYKPDYKDVTDQELKNWIRMNEQDIREYTREAKKYEKFGSRPEFKGSYDASQYGHAIGEIEDRKEKIKWMQDELARRKRTGNSKVGNGITKFGLGHYVIADGHKAIVLGETVERGPNGIPFGWVTIRWVEGPWKGQSDQQYDYDLKKA